MRLSVRHVLIALSGLMPVASTGVGVISVGLKYTNFTYTDKPQVATPNGLNHIYVGGEFKASDQFNLFAHFNHSLQEELITILREGELDQSTTNQPKRYGVEVGISYHLLSNVDIFAAGAFYRVELKEISGGNTTQLNEDEKHVILGVTSNLHQFDAFSVKARSSISLSNTTAVAETLSTTSTSFALELAYDL